MRARGPRTPFKRNCVTNGTKIILLSGWFRWKKLPWMSYRLKKTYPFSHYPLHTRTHSPDFGWIQTCPESARLSICHRTHTCPEVSTWGVESSVQASLGHCLMTGNSHNSWPLILLIVFFQKIFHMVPHVVTSQSPQIYRIWFSYLTELCTFWFSVTTAHVNYIFWAGAQVSQQVNHSPQSWPCCQAVTNTWWKHQNFVGVNISTWAQNKTDYVSQVGPVKAWVNTWDPPNI